MDRHSEEIADQLLEWRQQRRANRLAKTLTPEVKRWIKSFVKSHWFIYQRDNKYFVCFSDKQDAMLFKLTWY